MALNDAAADAAIDAWIATLSPTPADPTAIRDGMRPLVRAIYAGIVAHAVVVPGSMVIGSDAVTGAGAIT